VGKSDSGFCSDLRRRISSFVDNMFGDDTTTPHGTRHSYKKVSMSVGGHRHAVRGEGPVVGEARSVAPFDRLRSSLMTDVDIRVGPSLHVEVRAQKNLLKYVETTVKDGELVLSMRSGSFTSMTSIMVVVTMPNLAALHLTGHGDAVVNGVRTVYFQAHHSGMGNLTIHGTAQTIDLDLSGHGNVVFLGIAADDLNLRHSGTGALRMSGTARRVKLDGSGHGRLSLGELVVENVELTHRGMGDLDLNANGTVTGSASGHGDIRVQGRASWRVRHTGMGNVSFR
jgi:hypothetical protein